jgi:predicted outer membrane repeat protein
MRFKQDKLGLRPIGAALLAATLASCGGGGDAGVSSAQEDVATALDSTRQALAATSPAAVCTAPIVAANTSATPASVGTGTAASCTEAALRLAVAGNPVVTFNCGASPVTIAIRSPIHVPANRNTVIDGGGKVTLDGGGVTRILSLVQANYRSNSLGLTLQHITLANGRAPGGGYVAPSSSNPKCAYGYKTGAGGAIEVQDARLHVIDTVFADNRAATPGPDVGGGAIYAAGSTDVTVVGSSFTGNSGSNAGAVGLLQTNFRVYNSVFQANVANGTGQNYRSAETASCPGVGHAGQGGAGGNAGAIGIDGSDDTDVVVCGNRFIGNTANELGGALSRTPNGSPRRTTIDRSLFEGNTAKQAGAFYVMNSAPLEILSSTLTGNKAVSAGAAQLAGSRLTVQNSTFHANEATKGVAGALMLNGNDAASVMRNVTFSANKASGGPGYFSAALFGTLNFPITNSVFANNTTTDPWNPMQCGFSAAPGANNLQWPRTRAVGGAQDTPCVSGIVFADPLLGALASNGGPTPTLLPAAASPLRKAGRSCPTTDQRGVGRSVAQCTIGAVE